MSQKVSFGEWLRKNAEKYLLEVAADEMTARYPDLCKKPYHEQGVLPFFWRNIFAPLYSKIPWGVRKRMILLSSYPGGERPHWGKKNH
ncbi:MAG TPA: hypothetical protein VH878_05600 [Thermodesulfobacteriota bacterium]|jgi:hypothetical protein